MDVIGLGHRLQTVRKKAGLTQQELCSRAGLSYSTLAKIERGAIRAPSIFTIQSIAVALQISLNDIMGEIVPQGVRSPEIPKKRSKSGVRFVYFDINGCLVRFFHRAFTRLAEETGRSADLIETTFWHYNDIACRGEMTMEEFNVRFAERVGLPEINWVDYYLAAVDGIPEMQELLDWAAEHYHVGLLSNIMPGFISAMRRAQLIPNIHYSAIVDSSEVGAIKPEPEIFTIAQEYAGVQPEEILFIDDSRANIVAAERFGWRVLWFDAYRPDESVARVRAALEYDEGRS